MTQQIGRQRLSTAEAQRLRVNLVRVAGLAIGLGLLMELLLVLGGATVAGISSLLDHTLWPFLVCLAVAVGQAVAGVSPARAGLFAGVVTPLAFLLAKVSQKAVVVLLDGTTPGAFITGDLLTEAGLRALEYAALGAALAWLARQPWAGALAYVGVGAAIGLLGGLLLAFFLPPGTFAGWAVEELVFPAGCALIIFVSETLTRLMPENTVEAS